MIWSNATIEERRAAIAPLCAAGYTYKELADEFGVTEQTIANFLHRNIPLRTMRNEGALRRARGLAVNGADVSDAFGTASDPRDVVTAEAGREPSPGDQPPPSPQYPAEREWPGGGSAYQLPPPGVPVFPGDVPSPALWPKAIVGFVEERLKKRQSDFTIARALGPRVRRMQVLAFRKLHGIAHWNDASFAARVAHIPADCEAHRIQRNPVTGMIIWSDSLIERVDELASQGHKDAALARMFGISRIAMKTARHRFGIKPGGSYQHEPIRPPPEISTPSNEGAKISAPVSKVAAQPDPKPAAVRQPRPARVVDVTAINKPKLKAAGYAGKPLPRTISETPQKPPRPEKQPARVVRRECTLLTLPHDGCHWPLDRRDGGLMLFCGSVVPETSPATSYCPHHEWLARARPYGILARATEVPKNA